MNESDPPIPPTCAVAFKEWAGVCRALVDGRQCVILRKGGIDEGPGGFAPEYRTFWLYPTHAHQAAQGLRIGSAESPESPEGFVDIRALAIVEAIEYLERPEALDVLADLHVWTAETVRKRFAYRRPGLWVLGVRVYHRPEPWRVAVTPEHAGCKSWVELETPLSTAGMTPALGRPEFGRRMARLREAMAPTP